MDTTLLAHQASPAIRQPPPWTRRLATELAGMLLWSALALLAALALDVRHALAVVSLALAAGTAMALIWLARLLRYCRDHADELQKCALALALTSILLAVEVAIGNLFPRDLGLRLLLGAGAGAMCVLSARLVLSSQARLIRLHRRRPAQRLALGLGISAIGSLTLALQVAEFLSMLRHGPSVLVYLLLAYEALTFVWSAIMIALGLGVATGNESPRALSLRRRQRRQRRCLQARRRRIAWLDELDPADRLHVIHARVLAARRMILARPAPARQGVALLVALMAMSVGLNVLARALLEGAGRTGILAGAMLGFGLLMAAGSGRRLTKSLLLSDQGACLVTGRREIAFLWDELRQLRLHQPWMGSWRLVFVHDRDGAQYTIKLHELQDGDAVVSFLEEQADLPVELLVRTPKRRIATLGQRFDVPAGPSRLSPA